MKKSSRLFLTLTILAFLINWGSPDSTGNGVALHKVNFFGTVEPRNGASFEVENIALSNKYKQIPLYAIPETSALNKEYNLSFNPKDRKKGIITKIDLSEIDSIIVPNPEITWIYKESEKHRTEEYIEIVVVSKDKDKTKRHYLKDLDRGQITCNEKSPAGPLEKTIALPAIKKITINGYKQRNDSMETDNCIKKCRDTK